MNLHIAYLPYNRGADPNLWSAAEDTPSGVTIHQLDEGIDTGDILYREMVYLEPSETLRSSYRLLQACIQVEFMSNFESILDGETPRRNMSHHYGTYHNSRDKEQLVLPKGWDTTRAEVRRLALEQGVVAK